MHPQMERLYLAARELRKVQGQSELARTLNTSPQTIHNWESRGVSKQGMLLAQRIVGCSASWLETGKGPMSLSGSPNLTPVELGAHRVPIISHAQAVVWTGISDPYAPGHVGEWLSTDLELSGGAFALEIKGDSMLPEFKSGDRVIIDAAIAPQPGDYVVAQSGEEEATFKKYRPRGMNERGDVVFELVPLNEDYPSMRSDLTPIKIVGVMVEHRKYRKRG
jgi:SOS-response transcriptional repressor LexA